MFAIRPTRCLLLGALIVSSAAAEEYELRFRPEPGLELAIEQSLEQKTVMELGPMGTQRLDSRTRMLAKQRVREGSAEHTRFVEQVIEHVTMSMTQGGKELMSFDSGAAGTAEAGANPFGAMVDKPFVLEFDDLGAIVGSEGLTEVFDSIAESAEDPQIKTIMAQSFNEEWLLQTMQTTLPVFPKEPVGAGDSWSREMDMANPAFGSVHVDATYTVVGPGEVAGEPCVRLAVEMLMELELDMPLLDQLTAGTGSEMDVKMDVDEVTSSGSMCIARRDGVALASEIEQDVAMSISISTEGQPGMEMKIQLEQVTRQIASR